MGTRFSWGHVHLGSQSDRQVFSVVSRLPTMKIMKILIAALGSLPWSQRFFLIFLRERDQEEAAKRVAKATRRERKTSGYLGLESHFHEDDSCQTRQIASL